MNENMNAWEFTRGDRLRRSLKVAGLSVNTMAGYLGVARETVSGWINDRHAPNRQTMMLWAQRTGAPLDWLLGTDTEPEDEPLGSSFEIMADLLWAPGRGSSLTL